MITNGQIIGAPRATTVDGLKGAILLEAGPHIEIGIAGNTITISGDGGGGGTVTSVSGTADRITVTDPTTTPVVDIAATYVGQTSITTLGTIGTGTWNAGVIAGQYGGTGVANTGKTITLGGNLTTSGAFNSTFTMTGTTNVTFPTSGTLATTAGTVLSITGTANRITIGGTATNPTIDIAATYVGQTSITTLGTIGTGVWQGTAIGVIYGGTGLTSYATGDLLYASNSTTLAKLADIATGNVVLSGGVGVAPSYGKVGLTTHVTGVLPYANGGTNASTSWTQGSIIFAGASAFAQNNSGLFWNNSTTQFSVNTNIPLVDHTAQINGSTAYVIAAFGTQTAIEVTQGFGYQAAFAALTAFRPTSGSPQTSAFYAQPDIFLAAGQTITLATCFSASPIVSDNAGTVTDFAGFYFNGGNTTGTGTYTNAYGMLIKKPLFGTTKITARILGRTQIGTAQQFDVSDAGIVTAGTWQGTVIDGTYINYNTTNLKVTASQLNTIQNINPLSPVVFASMTLNGSGFGSGLLVTSGGVNVNAGGGWSSFSGTLASGAEVDVVGFNLANTFTSSTAGNTLTQAQINSTFTINSNTTGTARSLWIRAGSGTVSSSLVTGIGLDVEKPGYGNTIITARFQGLTYFGTAQQANFSDSAVLTLGTPLSPASGGTGVANNAASTLTISGSFASTFTMTNTTAVTFPTSGTLATVGATVASITGTANQVLANGTSGSAQTGAVTLTLPQDIATSTTTFQITGMGVGGSAATSAAINVNSARGFGVWSRGTQTGTVSLSVPSGVAAAGWASTSIISPGLGIDFGLGALYAPDIRAPIGNTIGVAAGVMCTPQFTSNAGTITAGYGFYFDGGSAATGTLTTGYGIRIVKPLYGTTKITAQFEGQTKFGTTQQSQFTDTGLLVIGSTSAGGFLDVQGSTSSSSAIYGTLLRSNLTITGASTGTGGVYIGGTHTINGSGSNSVTFLQVAPTIVATTAISSIVGQQIYGPSISGAAATTNCYGLLVSGAAAVGAGGLTNSYSGYFIAPAVGTNKTTLYSDDISIGYTGITPPTNGLVVSGNTGFGTSSPSKLVHLSSSVSNEPTLIIESTNADAFPGNIKFMKNGGAGTANDSIGEIYFDGPNSSNAQKRFADITCTSSVATASSEQGSIFIRTAVAGAVTDTVTLVGRHLGINSTTPLAMLEVAGGADSDGSTDFYDIALAYRSGGYRHWIRSRHNTVAVSNAIDFFVNNSATAGGSSAPGTGNIFTFSMDAGNISLGSVGSFGGGIGVFFAANANTVPTSSPTGGSVYYVQSGATKIRGSGGTITTIANANPHCPVCETDYVKEWESERYGYFAVCLNCLPAHLPNFPYTRTKGAWDSPNH